MSQREFNEFFNAQDDSHNSFLELLSVDENQKSLDYSIGRNFFFPVSHELSHQSDASSLSQSQRQGPGEAVGVPSWQSRSSSNNNSERDPIQRSVTLVCNEHGDLVPTDILDPRKDHHRDLMLQMQLQRFYKQYGMC